MARILRFQRPDRRQGFRWPVAVRNRRWQQPRGSAVRWQTLVLLSAFVFMLGLSALQGGWLSPGIVGAAPPGAPPSWMRSVHDERFVEPDRPIDSAVVASNPLDPGAPLASRDPASGVTGAAATSASFGFCHSGGGVNCVVDGDTFWLAGEKIRIADIDAPETHPPRCAAEAAEGAAATRRLQALLNAGPFVLERIDRDSDRYGRKLRLVTRGGESLGGVLVSEGLARWYAGGRQPWC